MSIEVVSRPKNSPLDLVKKAIELKKGAEQEKNEFDSVWVVIDKDSYSKLEETFSLAGKNNICIAFSSRSFEIWYLLHFYYTAKPWRNSSEVEKELLKKYPGYDKSGSDTYSDLKDKTSDAIENAERLREHHKSDLENGTPVYDLMCYTDVDALVQILITE